MDQQDRRVKLIAEQFTPLGVESRDVEWDMAESGVIQSVSIALGDDGDQEVRIARMDTKQEQWEVTLTDDDGDQKVDIALQLEGAIRAGARMARRFFNPESVRPVFNITGHKIEITGLRMPTPQEVNTYNESGVDVSDFGAVKAAVEREGEFDLLAPEEVAMVVWGEDMARIPLLVFNTEGEVMFREKSVPGGCLEQYEQAARMINLGMMAEQQLAQEERAS